VREHCRVGAVAVVCFFLVACGAGENGTAKPEGTTKLNAVAARPLAVRADGILDPDRIDLSGAPGVTHAEQIKAENLLRSTILTIPSGTT
jgi:hypothetical protein